MFYFFTESTSTPQPQTPSSSRGNSINNNDNNGSSSLATKSNGKKINFKNCMSSLNYQDKNSGNL